MQVVSDPRVKIAQVAEWHMQENEPCRRQDNKCGRVCLVEDRKTDANEHTETDIQ